LNDIEAPLDNINLDLEIEQKSTEMNDLETEVIKKRGDQIAKAQIVKRQNEFVQEQVDDVIQNIALI
jgi:hypothetical protein